MQVFSKKLFSNNKKLFSFKYSLPALYKKSTVPSYRMYGGAAVSLNEEEISGRILQVIKNFEKVDPNSVTNKSHFINDLGLDSLDAVEIGLAIEDEFGVEIPEQVAENILSVPDAVQYILTNPHAR